MSVRTRVRAMLLSSLVLAAVAVTAAPAQAAPNNFVTMPDGVADRDQRAHARRLRRRASSTRRSSRCRATTAARPTGGTLLNDFGLNEPAGAAERRQPPAHRPLQRRSTSRSTRRCAAPAARAASSTSSAARAPRTASTSSTSGSRSSRGRTATSRYIGHSYGGITGFMIAATQPQHLRVDLAVGPDRRHVPRDHLSRAASPTTASRSRGPARIRPAYDLLGGVGARHLPRGDRRRRREPPPALRATTRLDEAPHDPRRPARPGAQRHRQRVVPRPLADHLRRPDQRADAHHRRLPGRADRPARPDAPVGAGRAACRSGSCSPTATTTRRTRATRARGLGRPQGVDRPLHGRDGAPPRSAPSARTARR